MRRAYTSYDVLICHACIERIGFCLGRSKATALDCVEEAKAASSKDSCRVLQEIAKASLQSADEPLFQALSKSGLAVNFPTVSLQLDNALSYPCLPPKEQLEEMAAQGCFHKVLGVPVAYTDYVLPKFWEKYKNIYPHHSIFSEQGLDYTHLLPFYLHGDGGRTFKKDPILILSMFSAFGEGTAKNATDLQPMKRPRMDTSACSSGHIAYEPGVNLLGSTLPNRFLFTAIKCELYKDKRERFQSLLHTWGCYLHKLFQEGFSVNGENWRVAILGLTGDAPFLREAGNHTRSFSNVGKSSEESANLKGCCWLCGAGKSNGPPFEDLRITAAAAWTGTVGPSNELPWSTPGPLLEYLPLNERDLASFYRPDLFHIFHAGVGKDFGASALIYVMKLAYKRRPIQLSVDLINGELRAFLTENKGERLNFGKFSLDMLGYASSRSFPSGHWSKNMDTSTVVKFVAWLCAKNSAAHTGDTILECIADACAAIGQFMHVVFEASFFLTESEGWQLVASGHAFLSCYARLARESCNAGLCLFKLKPKVHMFAHIVHTAFEQYKLGTDLVINPVAESTFMLEDFVGKVARLSRRVSPKLQGVKIIYRYLVAVHQELHGVSRK